MSNDLQSDGMDVANVLSWTGRSRRAGCARPRTYWEEYVETDEWYRKKLLEDVPESEMHAACVDESFSEDIILTEDESSAADEEDGDEMLDFIEGTLSIIDSDYEAQSSEYSSSSDDASEDTEGSSPEGCASTAEEEVHRAG